MAFDAYLKIDGINGEATDANHKDWLQLTSYRLPVTHTQSGTGRSAPGASELTITKLMDAASPKLYEAINKGTHLKEAVIELVHTGGKSPFLVIRLTDVLITSALDDAEATGTAKFPMETISLNYSKIQWTYTQQKADGSAAGTVAAEWTVAQAPAA